jgi:hypothetical protein
MHKFIPDLSKLFRYLAMANGVLVVVYIGLVAVAMTYATLEVEFADSIKSDESSVATLESTYLQSVDRITMTNTSAAGYSTPLALVYVPGASETALSTR